MIAECHLCGQEKQLQQSHVIPKFVYNFIKKTSATGKIRQSVNVSRRLQDGTKDYLYCRSCELLFSKLERYFSLNFFYPYVQGKKDNFSYDENLKKFIISLCWRILDQDLKAYQNQYLSNYTES